ncbi:MAG: permease [Hyphomicrobiales bacterium]|nr:permease [Hyphomicrobiales bacterium]
MSIFERYVFRTALGAFLTGLCLLTGVVWLAIALRQVDLMATKGQTLWIFLAVTGLTIPSLVMVIAPIAIFIAVLYTLNKLNGDSELVVMSATGMSGLRLLAPFAFLAVFGTALVAATSLWAMPASFREITSQLTKIRADMLTRVIREGQFIYLDNGFVFHYRERAPNGDMHGLFIQDRREPDKTATYIAEAGRTIEMGPQNYLVLEKGSIQRQAKDSLDPAIIAFERYAIDLAQFSPDETGPVRPRERTTLELLRRDPNEPMVRANPGRFRQELHERFLNPLFALVFTMVAFAALHQPKTTRQGRGVAIAIAIGIALTLRLAGFGTAAMLVRSENAVWLAYGLPLLAFAASLIYVIAPDAPRRLAERLGALRRPASLHSGSAA